MQDVRGLTSLNKQLLKQRGIKGEPANQFHEASKTLITMASVADEVTPDSLPITNISDEQPQQQAEQQVEQENGQEGEHLD